MLPGRIGEFARVGVLTRKMPGAEGATPTLLGTVFAHRVFDVIPSLILIGYVLLTAKIPHWAITSMIIVAGVGVVLFGFAIVSGRLDGTHSLDELGSVRRLLAMARRGLGVMRNPLAALLAILLQTLGWFWQLLAVYTAMRAFDIHEPLPAAALVLVLMNVAGIFPLWPGNVGLLQAAVALPLVSYGVPYARGSRSGSGCRRSRCPSASGWASSSWRARASRSRCCAGCRPRRPRPRRSSSTRRSSTRRLWPSATAARWS